MRVGVIGTGFGARVVAPAFAAVAGCEVVDVVTPREPAAVSALCRRRDVDLISVHSPPFLHEAHVLAAIGGGHHVLCDKPFGRSAAEAQRMLAAAESAGVLHFANFEFRFDTARVELKRLLGANAIGDVVHASWVHMSATTRHPLRPAGWLFDRDSGGGWIGAWGSHAVDALRWLVGEVAQAWAAPRIVIDGRGDAEDAFTASLVFASGATAAIDSTSAAGATIAPRLTIVGTDGVLECVADRFLSIRHSDGTKVDVPIPAPAATGDPHIGPVAALAAAIHAAVERSEPITPSLLDAVACARVLDQLRAGPRA